MGKRSHAGSPPPREIISGSSKTLMSFRVIEPWRPPTRSANLVFQSTPMFPAFRQREEVALQVRFPSRRFDPSLHGLAGQREFREARERPEKDHVGRFRPSRFHRQSERVHFHDATGLEFLELGANGGEVGARLASNLG